MPCTALVFRRPVFMTDSIIAMYAGDLVHVDMLPIDDRNGENSLTCTSYIGETFSMSLSAKHLYNDKDNVALLVPTTEQEQDNITSYLHDLVEADIPYNYADVAAVALPTSLRKCLFDDVHSESPKDIKSVFCSQAAVLTLRNGLDRENPVGQLMATVNSRCILPNALYNLLNPMLQRVSCSALQRGAVVPYMPPHPA